MKEKGMYLIMQLSQYLSTVCSLQLLKMQILSLFSYFANYDPTNVATMKFTKRYQYEMKNFYDLNTNTRH